MIYRPKNTMKNALIEKKSLKLAMCKFAYLAVTVAFVLLEATVLLLYVAFVVFVFVMFW